MFFSTDLLFNLTIIVQNISVDQNPKKAQIKALLVHIFPRQFKCHSVLDKHVVGTLEKQSFKNTKIPWRLATAMDGFVEIHRKALSCPLPTLLTKFCPVYFGV